jgi:hypothetical protein
MNAENIPLRKSELELRKLELEVRDMERPFYKRLSFLSILVPVVSALLVALIGYIGDARLSKLEERRAALEANIQSLAREQAQLSINLSRGIEAHYARLNQLFEKAETPGSEPAEQDMFELGFKLQEDLIDSLGNGINASANAATLYADYLSKDENEELTTALRGARREMENFMQNLRTAYQSIEEIYKSRE